MSTLTIELEEPLKQQLTEAAIKSHLPLSEWVKASLSLAAKSETCTPPVLGMNHELFGAPPPSGPRVLGLHAGEKYRMAADFNDPLDEEFNG